MNALDVFDLPSVMQGMRAIGRPLSLSESVQEFLRLREDKELQIVALSCRVEERVQSEYGISLDDRAQIYEDVGIHPGHTLFDGEMDPGQLARLYSASEADLISEIVTNEGGSRSVTKKCYIANRKLELLSVAFKCSPEQIIQTRRRLELVDAFELCLAAKSVASFALGCAVGRWDVRRAVCRIADDAPENPFAPIPVCAPAMLQGLDGLPLIESPDGYPIPVKWDGILVDDSDHTDDIVRRVREALEAVWQQRTDAIEGELCHLLGTKELREYYRKPGKGGFWEDHISRYSQSRRKAPIYWLLQSSKKNYAIWLYYHRLDKDLLFKSLVNYVEPKIRLEASRLESLCTQRAAAGGTGRESKRLGKEIERQEEFLSELRDFEDKLRRAANLHLEPDLDDGVVLNIAPLWELVPWKEAKNYWEELLEGKYEWSSIGKQLRQKEVVK